MSLRLIAQEEIPVAFFMFDDASPFTDHSGRGKTATTRTITNILPHGNVENSAGFLPNNTEWTRFIDTSVKRSGTKSARINHNQSKNIGPFIASIYAVGTNSQLNISPNSTYGMGAWVMSNVAATAAATLSWYQSSGTHIISDKGGNITLPANTWVWVPIVATSPPDAAKSWTQITVTKQSGNAAATDYAWLDDAVMILDPPENFGYFDGDTVGASWTGAPNNSTSTISATLPSHAALVSDASRSLIVGDLERITVDAPVYRQGFEHLPFSIELAVRSIKKAPTNTAPQQIFGNAGEMDGLTIAGTVISFSTKYTNTGEAKCSFDMQENKAAFVDALHLKTKNQLYVDGDLVAEVDITPEQQADTYLSAGTTMSMGATTSGNLLAINGLSLYRNEIEPDAIFQHYTAATENLAEAAVATAFGGANLDLSPEQSNPYFIHNYTDEAEWSLGFMSFTAVEYGQLVPQVREGASVAGNWTVLQPLPQFEGTLYGVTLNWEGEGATIETSLDGATWVPVSRGARTPTIPTGFNPVGKFLYIRASFAGGVVNDESYLDNLAVAIYVSNKLPPFDGRDVTLTNASIENGSDVLEYNENYGVEVTAGSISIAAASTNSMTPKTIECWVKIPVGGSFGTNFFSGATVYSDGGPSKSLKVDEWQLLSYVNEAGFGSGALTFTGTFQLGTVTMYPYAHTQEQAYKTYKSYTGIPSLVITETGNIGIEDIPDYVDIYGYDWSIESAG